MKRSWLFLLLLSAPLWAQPVLHTDHQRLPRDYRCTPVIAVSPQLFEQVPWQVLPDGLRRKVLFNDRLTMVLLEIDRAVDDKPMQTHYHVHDQITYVLEGRARVSLAGSEKEVEAGAAYVAPSNVPHGLKPLSRRVVIVECFTPTREDFRSAFSSNDLRAFVYQWFAQIERGAPLESLQSFLDQESLTMQFSNATLRSPAEFAAFYGRGGLAGLGKSHELRAIEVIKRTDTQFKLSFEAKAGQEQWIHYEWEVDTQMGQPKIRSWMSKP
jgi:quercetin dioxygenase-like cupin family protein